MFYENLILSLAAWLNYWSGLLEQCCENLEYYAEDLAVSRIIDQERKSGK